MGLIGANGAGKSTLMKAMLGLIPAKGKITVDETEVNQENSSRIRQCLRYVFQDSDNQMFMPTVYEDMIFGPLNYGKSRKEADQLAREALEELDLIHLKDRQLPAERGLYKFSFALVIRETGFWQPAGQRIFPFTPYTTAF